MYIPAYIMLYCKYIKVVDTRIFVNFTYLFPWIVFVRINVLVIGVVMNSVQPLTVLYLCVIGCGK